MKVIPPCGPALVAWTAGVGILVPAALLWALDYRDHRTAIIVALSLACATAAIWLGRDSVKRDSGPR